MLALYNVRTDARVHVGSSGFSIEQCNLTLYKQSGRKADGADGGERQMMLARKLKERHVITPGPVNKDVDHGKRIELSTEA
ncbi:hypothetical protein F2P81_015784 [Scophthalmus maximus]|uniref:Uncharacterized protein n=1 Tax=Scophthalmus maximus TaxID=52904 RepID=A0A6A4SFG8_SCOMX|nr:hypothetical protein F2P81_015784 [Scophthalmus maximus]